MSVDSLIQSTDAMEYILCCRFFFWVLGAGYWVLGLSAHGTSILDERGIRKTSKEINSKTISGECHKESITR